MFYLSYNSIVISRCKNSVISNRIWLLHFYIKTFLCQNLTVFWVFSDFLKILEKYFSVNKAGLELNKSPSSKTFKCGLHSTTTPDLSSYWTLVIMANRCWTQAVKWQGLQLLSFMKDRSNTIELHVSNIDIDILNKMRNFSVLYPQANAKTVGLVFLRCPFLGGWHVQLYLSSWLYRFLFK